LISYVIVILEKNYREICIVFTQFLHSTNPNLLEMLWTKVYHTSCTALMSGKQKDTSPLRCQTRILAVDRVLYILLRTLVLLKR